MATPSASRISYRVKVLLIIAAAALTVGLLRVVLYQSIAGRLEALARSIPGCTGIRYAKLSIPLFELQCRLQNAVLLFEEPHDNIAVEAIHVRRFRPGASLPRILDARLTGVALNADHPLMASLTPQLQRLGYAVIKGNIELQWIRRGAKQETWDVDLMLQAANAGELTLSTRLEKVNAEGVVMALGAPLNWLLVLPAVELVSAQAAYLDEGLFRRAMAEAARRRGQRPEAVRRALLQRLEAEIQGEMNPGVRSFWQSAAAFSRQPGRFAVHTNLSQPVPLGQLLWSRQPRDVIQRLALESRTG
jgi:hypothetical protein